MTRRFVWLSLVLLISLVATFFFLSSRDTEDIELARTPASEDFDASPSIADAKRPFSASSVVNREPPDSQDWETADGATSSTTRISAPDHPKPLGFHEVALSEVEKANLLQAPNVFLNRIPSDVLAKAIELGRIDVVRADRDFDQNEYVTQGWIYFEPIDGQVPTILCLSQSKMIIDWMHCQEETSPQLP